MMVLLALLWCVYVSECVVRQRPGEWLFKARLFKGSHAIGEAEVQFLAGRIGLSWTTLLPWTPAYLLQGNEFDLDAGRTRLRRIEESSRWLRLASGALFTWVMCGLTLLILTDRLLSILLPYAIVAALLWFVTFLTFIAAFQRVHDRRPACEIWLTAALSPVSLMRGPHTVGMSAVKQLNPVTAAAILADDADFLRIARMWHFDVTAFRPAIERLARSRNLLRRLTAPPETWDAGLTRYCPRCHETYGAGAARCADCLEVPLQILPGHS